MSLAPQCPIHHVALEHPQPGLFTVTAICPGDDRNGATMHVCYVTNEGTMAEPRLVVDPGEARPT